jgi:hypothetical protein
LFLDELVRVGGRTDNLTVVLSFPTLANWLANTQTAAIATQVVRDLWRHLREFTERNYSTQTGSLKPQSVMAKKTAQVGVVVESRRVSFRDMGEAFCKKSVLLLPPFSDEEIIAYWKRRYKTSPAREVVEYVRTCTAGAPWFMRFLLDCFDMIDANGTTDADTNEKTLERLRSAMDVCGDIVFERLQGSAATKYRSLYLLWTTYRDTVKSRLSSAALTNLRIRDVFNTGNQVSFQITEVDQSPEWLESGMIWLRNSVRPFSLRALERYPYVSSHAPGELHRQVYEAFVGGED